METSDEKRKRVLRLLRSAKTKATAKYGSGGRLKGKGEAPRPVTLPTRKPTAR